jgi:hypothetical protein
MQAQRKKTLFLPDAPSRGTRKKPGCAGCVDDEQACCQFLRRDAGLDKSLDRRSKWL